MLKFILQYHPDSIVMVEEYPRHFDANRHIILNSAEHVNIELDADDQL